jgi:hypothetical protein
LFFALVSIAVAVGIFGCSTISQKQGRNILAKDCGEFCEKIQACSKKAGHPKLGRQLCKLARCETGSKCTGDIASLNGLYFGAFQFSRQTWKSRCPLLFERLKMADQCSGDDAIYDVCCASICSAEIIADGGANNWPVCRHKAGL